MGGEMILKRLVIPALILCSISLANAGAASSGSGGNSGALRIDDTIVSNDFDMLAAFAAPSPIVGFGMEEPDWQVICKKNPENKYPKDCFCTKDGKTTPVLRNGKGSCVCVEEGGTIDKKDHTCHCEGKECKSVSP
jgi:hypothetical protein